MDANVLIDYQKSDISVLGLVSQHTGEVQVLTTILPDTRANCPSETISASGSQPPEASSASRMTRHCGPLCSDAGVPTMWGLEIMVALVRGGAMEVADALWVTAPPLLGSVFGPREDRPLLAPFGWCGEHGFGSRSQSSSRARDPTAAVSASVRVATGSSIHAGTFKGTPRGSRIVTGAPRLRGAQITGSRRPKCGWNG